MATAEEILEAMELEDDATVCRIDVNSREITIPESLKLVGVESDDDVTRRHFEMDSQYGEIDLSEFNVRINYRNANNEDDVYLVEDRAAENGKLKFSWLIGRSALRHKGKIRFVICLYKMSNGEKAQEWNSTLGEFSVLEGLEPDADITKDPDYDIVTQLLKIADGTANRATAAAERAEKAAERAEAAGGSGTGGSVDLDNTLTQSGKAADAKATGDALNELKEAIDNKVGTSELNTAVDNALTTAKESGEFKGDKGDPGKDGAPGETGPAGYTPQRGTDYWTTADRQQIVSDVLSALPNASGVSF